MDNYSLYGIPAFYLVCILPKTYGVTLVAKFAKWDMINPNNTKTAEHYKRVVPPEVHERYERSCAASRNGWENAPFFIGAVLAGNMAGLSNSTMNSFSVGFLGLRILYAFVYIRTEKPGIPWRSLVFNASVIWYWGIYIAAGRALAASSR